MYITRVTANIILLIMAGTWSWLSISKGALQPVTDQFVWLAGALASGEGIGYFTQKYKGLKNDTTDPKV